MVTMNAGDPNVDTNKELLPVALKFDTRVWWKHRRRHSYLSMLELFLIGLIALIGDPEQIEAAGPILQTLAWIFGSIVLLFVGAATVEDVTKILSLRTQK